MLTSCTAVRIMHGKTHASGCYLSLRLSLAAACRPANQISSC